MMSQPFLYGEGADAVTLSAYVPVWTCDSCGEQYTDGDAERIRHDVVCDHLQRLTPDQLREARTRAGHTQESWAMLTRLGIASIKRWESAKQIQSASADLLIRLMSNPLVRSTLVETKSMCGRMAEPSFQAIVAANYSRQAAEFDLRPARMN